MWGTVGFLSALCPMAGQPVSETVMSVQGSEATPINAGMGDGEQGVQPDRRMPRWLMPAVVGVLGLVAYGALLLSASMAMCGISGCTGNGYGLAYSPSMTIVLLVGAGLVGAIWVLFLSRPRLVFRILIAIGLSVSLTLVGGVAIGASWDGCPRDLHDRCVAEQQPPA